MAQKVKVQRRGCLPPTKNDTVIFMAAYDVHEFKRCIPHFWQRARAKELMTQHHITSIATKDTIVFPAGKLRYTAEYDPIISNTSFNFQPYDKKGKIEDFQDSIGKLNWQLYMIHAVKALLDESLYKISFTFNLDSFLVYIGDELLQVDPVVFMMNGILFVNYELIHFKTGVPLTHSEIYGHYNNYNILPAKSMRYFDTESFIDENKKISDIIFLNVRSFLENVCQQSYSFGEFSFVHNTFVVTNRKFNMSSYFMKVVGAEINDFQVRNISTTKAYAYYASEFLGVCTDITSDELHHIMFDCLLLEAVKMYLCLNMIVDFEVTEGMEKLINRQIYVERLCYPYHVPIITHNAIENIKQTNSYKRYKAAVDFKQEVMKYNQEKRRDKNGRLLNVLLYLLSFFGCIGTLEILEERFALPFNWGLIIALIVFGVGGFVWMITEQKD